MQEAARSTEHLIQEAFNRIQEMSEQFVELKQELYRLQLKVDILEDRLAVLRENGEAPEPGKRIETAASDARDRNDGKKGHPFDTTRKEKFKRRGLF